MIHQELNLMAPMTVAENIWIRREPTNRFGFVDHGAMHRKTAELFKRLNIDIDPDVAGRHAQRRQPPDGRDRQGGLLRIRRADHGRADLGADRARGRAPVHDHPRRCKAEGKGIIYITHKMNELFEIADECLGVPRRQVHRHQGLARGDARRHHPHDGRPRDHPDVPQGRRCRSAMSCFRSRG